MPLSPTDIRAEALAKRPLLIASQGMPYAPARGEAVVARLAREVRRLQPGREVAAATLANDARLTSVVGSLECPIVFPLFVSNGREVTTDLPRRLSEAGVKEWATTVPFGLLRDLRPRAIHTMKAAMLKHGLPTVNTTLILAVDSDPHDTRTALAAQEFARAMMPSRMFKAVRVGFLRSTRFLPEDTAARGQVLVVPFMAEKRPGVEEEIMAALAEFHAIGPILNPIGTWPNVPALISHAVRAHAMNVAL